MTNSSSAPLNTSLKRYQTAIIALEDLDRSTLWQVCLLLWTLKSRSYSLMKYVATRLSFSNPSKEQILETLIARDAVQADLMAQSPPPKSSLLRIEELDNRLKAQSATIAQTIKLADWRSLINPSTSNWWWFLEESPFHPQNRWDPIWQGLSLVLLTISFAVGTSVYSAWFSIGLDAFGSFFASAQGVATLLLGSRLFSTEENKPLLGYSRIPRYVWHQRICQLSFLLTGSVLGLYFLQPTIADKYYTNRGISLYNAIPRQIAGAKANFERAIKLDPDNAEAHYGLGNIYEELGKLKLAQAEYETALQGGLPDAYNNLARLYILDRQFDKAAVLLEQGLERVPRQNWDVEYSLRKNLGWARLKQKRYVKAEAELREAVELLTQLNRNEAAPYCLLAQVLNSQDRQDQARENWANCKQYASPSKSLEEDSWLYSANQQLQGEKP